MNCAEVERHLPDLVAGEFSMADRAALQAHLEACPTCWEACMGLVELAAQLDRLPMEKPSPALRERFYEMLENAAEDARPLSRWSGKRMALAAAVLLLVGGSFLGGYWIRGGSDAAIPAQNGNLALLRQSGPGLRMAGIMLVSQGDPNDAAPAEALLDLLDRDPNESVRLAAVDALYLYGRQPRVRERLADAMARQTSPRVQLALVDLLGGLREQRASEALKSLLQAPGTTPEVARRVQAQLQERPL
jgi:anti-sigma factor RsiW